MDCPTIRCAEHRRDCELICYQCNLAICSRCVSSHTNHTMDHIDDIADSKLLDDNEHQTKECLIKSRLSQLWSTMRELTERCHSLQSQEGEISGYFGGFHEYLVLQEHKLKKTISTDFEQLKQHLETQLSELKSLVNILKITSTAAQHNGQNGQSAASSSSSSSSMSCDGDIHEDTTDRYQLENIIKSIKETESIISFIENNNSTLFYNPNHHGNERINDRDFKLELFDLMIKHNSQFNLTSSLTNEISNDYKLSINQDGINNSKNLIEQSLKVVVVPPPLRQINKQQPNEVAAAVIQPKQLYIVAADKEFGITFININTKEKESFKIDYNLHCTFANFLRIGEHLYVFGGSKAKNTQDKYCRISLATKSIDLNGDIDGLLLGRSISLCYDGQDYIYLINGYNETKKKYLNRVDRFNINTRQFEKYHVFVTNDLLGVHILSFFHQGMIYSIPYNRNVIVQFDTENKTSSDIKIQKVLNTSKPRAACTDGNGSIYIHTDDMRFIRYNIETEKFTTLEPLITLGDVLSMNYLTVNNNNNNNNDIQSSYIYLVGGHSYGNHRYNISSCEWELFDMEDDRNRIWCGSKIIEI
ncbi:hypothetical protein PPL_02667 [Heterostelium album PN500]|uniref:B box-type domain-containing protein n=1 Tax=Heterostelium pallidum (strain ATCC 26659 / Pp 5 / PN500) TaxID=670386 RepID=D3B2Q3_HETP5|nr:hypothetical protein PPL_02667 [Heterostelium album PN500]EFA83601.1 hypothetical protein PPL_02667 [Heterostelium album PN500]|eukprot:XP_020435718.1 hypothetical protein PPL_02667 [Heterostelium album PN500]